MGVKSTKLTLGEVSDLHVDIVIWVTLSVIFPPESPKRARLVGGVRCLRQGPKKNVFFLPPSLTKHVANLPAGQFKVSPSLQLYYAKKYKTSIKNKTQ